MKRREGKARGEKTENPHQTLFLWPIARSCVPVALASSSGRFLELLPDQRLKRKEDERRRIDGPALCRTRDNLLCDERLRNKRKISVKTRLESKRAREG